MIRRPHFPALVASLICATALGGCLTQHVQPTPSKAVLETRARQAAKPTACAVGDLASVSPMDVNFGFAETQLDDPAQRQVAKAADWLKCNPSVGLVILPSADGHGTTAQQQEISQARAKAVIDALRAAGATGTVVRTLAMGAADDTTAPHVVINAQGRGW